VDGEEERRERRGEASERVSSYVANVREWSEVSCGRSE